MMLRIKSETDISTGAAPENNPVSGDGASISVPSGFDSPEATSEATSVKSDFNFSDIVPEAYREKPYIQELLKNENPAEQLFKQFDGLQTKLGQRPEGVPGKDATDEDWTKFYKSIGMPETPDEYAYELPELGEADKGLSDFINSQRNPEFEAKVKELAHEAKLTKEQWAVLAPGFDKLVINEHKEMFQSQLAQQADLHKNFDDLTNDFFGQEADAKLDLGKKMLNNLVSDKARTYLDTLPNESLVVLADVMNNVYNSYGKEDTFDLSRNGSTVGSADDIRARARELRAKPQYSDELAPGHDALVKEVNELYQQLGRFMK